MASVNSKALLELLLQLNAHEYRGRRTPSYLSPQSVDEEQIERGSRARCLV